MTPTANLILECEGGNWATFPEDVLWGPFSNPDDLPNDANAVGVVCRHCTQVRIHFLDEERRVTPQGPAENLVIFCEPMMLPCEDPSCGFRLPIMGEKDRSMTDAAYNEYRRTWSFGELACPNGHPIYKPVEWQDGPSGTARTFRA